MNIAHTFPPNYDQIVAAIPGVAKRSSIIFTYGDTIYVPSRAKLPDHLIAHEEVHSAEQARIGVDTWWFKYLESPRFRLEQELMAYQAQYKVLLHKHPRHIRNIVLLKISDDLAGAMYGNIVNKQEARKLITGGKKL